MLYLLRVWRDPDHFHASVRAVGEEQARHFERPEQLLAFLDAPRRVAPPDNPADERNRHA